MLPQQDSPTNHRLDRADDPTRKIKNLLERQRLLLQIAIEANSSATLEEALATVVSRLRDAGTSDRISILLPNASGQLQVKTSTGYEISQGFEQSFAPGEGITGQAAAGKKPIRVDDVLAVPEYISLDDEVRSELAVPILFRDELIGVLNLESTQPNYFDDSDQTILEVLCINLGSVISNFRLMEQVHQQTLNERMFYESSSHIRRSVNLETILKTAAKEIALGLGARKVKIQIATHDTQDASQTPDSGQAVPSSINTAPPEGASSQGESGETAAQGDK